MAGEDFLIKVGVDYSSAIASTQRFQREIEQILARTGSGIAQGQSATSAVASQSQVAGFNASRELAGIQRSLDTLVAQQAQHSDRLIAVLSSTLRTTVLRQQPVAAVQSPSVPPPPAGVTVTRPIVPQQAPMIGLEAAQQKQQAAIERNAVITLGRVRQNEAFATREKAIQNQILQAYALELQDAQRRAVPVATPMQAQVARPAAPPIIPSSPAAPVVVPQPPKPIQRPAPMALPQAAVSFPQVALSGVVAAVAAGTNQRLMAQQESLQRELISAQQRQLAAVNSAASAPRVVASASVPQPIVQSVVQPVVQQVIHTPPPPAPPLGRGGTGSYGGYGGGYLSTPPPMPPNFGSLPSQGWGANTEIVRYVDRFLQKTIEASMRRTLPSSGSVFPMGPGLDTRVFYHGTTLSPFRETPDVIRPSGGPPIHPGVTDPRYAYATTDLSAARAYAEMAWQSREEGFPAVLKVVPLGHVENDPRYDTNGNSRGNFEGDKRSSSGFRVVGKLPFGDEEEWLESREISAYRRRLNEYRELEKAATASLETSSSKELVPIQGSKALVLQTEAQREYAASLRRSAAAHRAEAASVLPPGRKPIPLGPVPPLALTRGSFIPNASALPRAGSAARAWAEGEIFYRSVLPSSGNVFALGAGGFSTQGDARARKAEVYAQNYARRLREQKRAEEEARLRQAAEAGALKPSDVLPPGYRSGYQALPAGKQAAPKPRQPIETTGRDVTAERRQEAARQAAVAAERQRQAAAARAEQLRVEAESRISESVLVPPRQSWVSRFRDTISRIKETAKDRWQNNRGQTGAFDLDAFIQQRGKAQPKLDLNLANAGQLTTLPGIGPATAKAILAVRSEIDAFKSIRGLLKVPGITQSKFDALKELVTVTQRGREAREAYAQEGSFNLGDLQLSGLKVGKTGNLLSSPLADRVNSAARNFSLGQNSEALQGAQAVLAEVEKIRARANKIPISFLTDLQREELATVNGALDKLAAKANSVVSGVNLDALTKAQAEFKDGLVLDQNLFGKPAQPAQPIPMLIAAAAPVVSGTLKEQFAPLQPPKEPPTFAARPTPADAWVAKLQAEFRSGLTVNPNLFGEPTPLVGGSGGGRIPPKTPPTAASAEPPPTPFGLSDLKRSGVHVTPAGNIGGKLAQSLQVGIGLGGDEAVAAARHVLAEIERIRKAAAVVPLHLQTDQAKLETGQVLTALNKLEGRAQGVLARGRLAKPLSEGDLKIPSDLFKGLQVGPSGGPYVGPSAPPSTSRAVELYRRAEQGRTGPGAGAGRSGASENWWEREQTVESLRKRLAGVRSDLGSTKNLFGMGSREAGGAAFGEAWSDFERITEHLGRMKVDPLDDAAVQKFKKLREEATKVGAEFNKLTGGGAGGAGAAGGSGGGSGGGGGGRLGGVYGGSGGREPGFFGGFVDSLKHNRDSSPLGFLGTGAMATLRYGLPSMVMFGASRGLMSGLHEAEQFQFAMSKIHDQMEATFGSGSDEIFSNFKRNILDIARDTGLQADKVATFALQVEGAFGNLQKPIGGLKGQSLVNEQTASGAKLAQATGLSIEEVTDGLTATSLAFGKTFKEIGDIAIGVESKSGVLAKQTIGFLGDVAPVAQEAGFSAEEIAAIAAAAQQRSGRSGTALAEGLSRILPQVAQNRDQLLELADSDAAFRSPKLIDALKGSDTKGIIFGLADAFDKMSKDSKELVINLLGGRREAQILIPILQNKKLLESYKQAGEEGESTGALEKRFQAVRGTLSNEIQRITETMKQMFVEVFEGGLGSIMSVVLKEIQAVANVFLRVFSVVGDINDLFGGWPMKLAAVAGSVALISKGFQASIKAIETARMINTGMALMNVMRASGVVIGGESVTGSLPLFSQSAMLRARDASGNRIVTPEMYLLSGGMRAVSKVGARARAGIEAYRAARSGAGVLSATEGIMESGSNAGRLALTAGEDAAGAGRLGALSSGLSAAAAGMSSTALVAIGVGTAALAVVGGTYLALKTGLEHQKKHAQEIADWARDSKTTATDLKALAKDPEFNKGPGTLARIYAAFTGERLLGERDLLKAELARREVTADERKQTGLLDAQLFADIIDKGTKLKPEQVAPGLNPVEKRLATRRARARADIANKEITGIIRDNSEYIASSLKPGVDTRVALGFQWTGKQIDAILPRLDTFGKIAGVKPSKLTPAVIKALSSGKSAKDRLIEIRDSNNNEFTQTDIDQARHSLEYGVKHGGLNAVATQALDVDKTSNTLATIRKNYESGVTGFATYMEATARNIENLRKNIGSSGTDNQLQRLAQEIRDFNQKQSQQAIASTNIQVETLTLGRGLGETETTAIQVQKYQELINSGKLAGKDRREIVKQLIGAQQAALLKSIENAGSIDEVRSIIEKGAPVSVETRSAAIIGAMDELNGNWEMFNEQWRKVFGATAESYVKSLVGGMQTGTMTVAQVREDLVKKKADLDAAVANQNRRGKGNSAEAVATKDAAKTVEGWINTIDTTGTLPGDITGKVVPSPDQAVQTLTKRSQSIANLLKSQSGPNSLAALLVDLDSANEELRILQSLTPNDENAIRDAQAKANNAQRAVNQYFKSKADAFRGVAKAAAQARHDSVGAAKLDLDQARADLQKARAENDEVAEAQAQASIITAQENIRQSQLEVQRNIMQRDKLYQTKGDSVLSAQADVGIAQFNLRNAQGDEIPQAQVALKQAEDAFRESIISRWRALRELAKAQSDDPVKNAQMDVETAAGLKDLAINEDQKIEAQRAAIEAQKSLQKAMSDVRNSMFDLRQAELQAMGDDVGASQVAAQKARAQLSEALSLSAQGRGPGDAEINRLKAAVITADKASFDAAFNDKLDDYKFLYDMGQMTKGEYINYLEGLKSTLLPGTKQFKDLELTIKGLKDDIAGGLQMNLPTSLALPTLYEVRRLDQSVSSSGAAVGYQDNRVQNIQVLVTNGMSQAEIINVLNQAMGNGVTGADARLY